MTSACQYVDPAPREALLGEQRERGLGHRVGVADADAAEELALDGHLGVAVVDAPAIPVGEHHPLDPGHHRVVEHLRGPAIVVETGAQRLGLDEEARLVAQEQRVVDRVVARAQSVLEPDVLEVLGVPAECLEHRHDEPGLGVLLADALAADAGDASPDRREHRDESRLRRCAHDAPPIPARRDGVPIVRAYPMLR